MLKSKLLAAGCGIAMAVAVFAGTGAAAADPAPDHGKKIIINGEERHDIQRIIKREDIPRELPGFDMRNLQDGSPGVHVLTNGEVQPIPPGAKIRIQRR